MSIELVPIGTLIRIKSTNTLFGGQKEKNMSFAGKLAIIVSHGVPNDLWCYAFAVEDSLKKDRFVAKRTDFEVVE